MALRIPLSWLQDYVDLEQDPVKLAEALTISGMEVESIEHLGDNWGEFCRVGEVKKVVAHPNADSLSIATVDYGTDQSLEVVTGAPNIRELEKQFPQTPPKIALALSGAKLINPYHEDHPLVRLKPSKIRGIVSEGMICSELELGLGEAHEGVLFLPDDAPVGGMLKDYLGDAVLEFDIKGGFAHLLSIYGLARETAAITRMRLKSEKLPDLSKLNLPKQPSSPSETSEVDFLKLRIENPDLCPRYSALLVRGITIGPSPFWMQQRLQRAGMRPINNIVDITNYVMLELGQPLHAFDYQALCQRAEGETPEIFVRCAVNGEVMTTLDGEERKLDEQMLMITDEAGLIAIAGVMGGEETEVGNETKDVLLESANFDFLNNRRTSQLLKLKTEASERFGKRLNADGTMTAALRAAELCVSIAGGTLELQAADLYPGKLADESVELDLEYLERVLGIKVEKNEVNRILEALEFTVQNKTDQLLEVTVPHHRLDIAIPADLVEEIARVYGYNRMPSTLIRDALPPQRENFQLQGVEAIRDILVASGMDEVITYTMTNPLDESNLMLQEGFDQKNYVPVKNPLSNERSHLRRKLLPGALHTARQNLRFDDQVQIFEAGGVFIPQENQVLPDEPMELCLLMTGKREINSWHQAEQGDMDFFDLKGVIENLFTSLHIQEVEWKKARELPYHPGRSSEILVNGVSIGIMGELHPDVRRLYELPDRPVVCAELQLSELLNASSSYYLMEEISTYSPIFEDLAFIVDRSVEVETLIPFILKTGKPLLKRVQLFDVYQGKGMEVGKKSLGFSLTYQASDRTLNDKDVEQVRNRIIKKVNQNFQATLRES